MFYRKQTQLLVPVALILLAVTLACGGSASTAREPSIVGTWQRTTPADQAGDLDLMVNDAIEFLADGTVIFSPTNVSGTYSFPDSEHITFNFPRGGLGYRFTLQNDVLTLITLDGKTTEYRRVQ